MLPVPERKARWEKLVGVGWSKALPEERGQGRKVQ